MNSRDFLLFTAFLTGVTVSSCSKSPDQQVKQIAKEVDNMDTEERAEAIAGWKAKEKTYFDAIEKEKRRIFDLKRQKIIAERDIIKQKIKSKLPWGHSITELEDLTKKYLSFSRKVKFSFEDDMFALSCYERTQNLEKQWGFLLGMNRDYPDSVQVDFKIAGLYKYT